MIYTSPLSTYTVKTPNGSELTAQLRAGLMAGDKVETKFGTVTVVETLQTIS